MNDLHDDLLEMFRRREGDVHVPASAPEKLIARTRRREWMSVGVGVAVGVIVVLVSIAGLRSLGSSEGSQPGDVGPTTTKNIDGITVTYPERWFAEDPVAIGIEPNDTPRSLPTLVLALTRDDPQIEGVLGCPGLADAPTGQLLMTVQEMPLALSGDGAQPWPIPLQTMDVGTTGPGGCYGGWTFMRASWTASGRSFEARVGFAADSSDADRTALVDAFTSMTFAPGSVSTQDEVQIASGVTESGATWSLTASRTGDLCWSLELESGIGGSGSGGCDDAQGSGKPSLIAVHLDPATTVIVGTIPDDAIVIEIDIFDPPRIAGIYQNPPMFPAPSEGWGDVSFMVFAAPGTSDHGSVRVRFQDLRGNDIYPAQTIEWSSPASSP